MKSTVISLSVAALLIFGAFLLVNSNGSAGDSFDAKNNVSIEDGKQIVKISAKGGYIPRRSVAEAGLPTIVRFDTRGTFDCSLAVRMPSVNVSQILPQSGTTDIDIGVQKVGLFQGSCGMGMYPFEIDFQNM
ncbi:MAG TPA: hypothetical protein VFQ59_02430 [Candidatus Paceibacterota bacterium]|nr:hypothetical protein [Candidatus Paceibacterota bacterium]